MGRLRLRTFIAVMLQDAVRRRVAALREEFAVAGPEVKWVEPENMHLTLVFLGEVDALELVGICRAVRQVASAMPPFELGAAGVGCFPNARRPRTVWVGVEEGRAELVALHHALEDALLKLGAYRREERDFTPHITLGRLKEDDATPEFRALLKREADWHGGRQAVREIHVMGSELTADGPRYTVLSREKLSTGVE